MQHVVATYHEGAASRNWFQPERGRLAEMGIWSELTESGATI